MIAFEECLAPFTVVPRGPLLETMCDIGVDNCIHHINSIDIYGDGTVADILKRNVATHETPVHTERYCGYRKFLSDICRINLVFP